MKKLFLPYWLCLILLIAATMLSGCQQNGYVNDTKTGAVTVESESRLKDGTYTAHGAFRDDAGYAPFLSLSVTKGIITKASYSEKDANGKIKTAFSDSEAKKNYTDPEDFYQALESSLITHQDTENLPGDERQSAADFKNLADAAMKNAESGITSGTAVNLERVYTATGMTAEAAPRRAKMTVTYQKGKISSIDFTVDGNTLTERAQIGEMIDKSIKADSLSDVSFNAKTTEELALLSAYNEALTAVAAKRIPVQGN